MNRRSVPEALRQVLEAGLDRSVELADRVELLQVRDDLVVLVVGQRHGLLDRLEPLGVLDVHPLGPLEEGEVAQRGLAERHQLDPDAGRVAVGRHREVRTSEARGRADGRQQVLDEREVEHLLLADRQERLAPAVDRGKRLGRQPLVDLLLERERREQVLEHDQVLELGGLPERVDQRLAVLEAAAARCRPSLCGRPGRWPADRAGRSSGPRSRDAYLRCSMRADPAISAPRSVRLPR